MRILFVASEVYPIAKTGGLADVAGSLPKALTSRAHEVSIVMPRYGSVQCAAETIGQLQVPMGEGKVETAGLQKTFLDEGGRITLYLVQHERYFGSRKDLYAFPDDGLRFAFFSRAVVEAVQGPLGRPEILHCHDWHTGLVPAYIVALGHRAPALQGLPTIFTIHNLQYQGAFGRNVFAYSGLPLSMLTVDGFEFYGGINFIKAGIVYSRLINTVSPTYAREIQTAEFGNGLSGLLQHHSRKLSGIVNGIDVEVWNPQTDPHLTVHFGPDDPSGKVELKRALQAEAGLPVDENVPIFSFIGRLVDQKGMDIVMPVLPEILCQAQVLVLGNGEPVYHERLRLAKEKHLNLSVFLKYDEGLAHKIYSGSDALLMPSLFEPCGLGQLIALRYGTLPIVRRTGGLADTVRDADMDPANGTGFSFAEYKPETLLDAVRRAVRAFGEKERWARLRAQAMVQDFSWTASMRRYEDLYRSALQ